METTDVEKPKMRALGRGGRATKFLARTAAIAALYAALTLALAPISYGPIQFRVSEALTVLPLFMPEAIPGLTIGCFLANIPSGILDMVLGSVATLLAAVLTRMLRKVRPGIVWGVIPPVLFNALLVPVIFLSMPDITSPYWLNVLTVGAGELLSVVALGVPFWFWMKNVDKHHPSLMN